MRIFVLSWVDYYDFEVISAHWTLEAAKDYGASMEHGRRTKPRMYTWDHSTEHGEHWSLWSTRPNQSGGWRIEQVEIYP